MLQPRRDFVITGKKLDQIFGVEVRCAFHQRRGGDQIKECIAVRHPIMADFVPWNIGEGPALPSKRAVICDAFCHPDQKVNIVPSACKPSSTWPTVAKCAWRP